METETKPLVAILFRQTRHWSEALETGQALLRSGAAVIFFCLENASMTGQFLSPEAMQRFTDLDVECYADSPDCDLPFLPVDSMAERLRQCDLVIPI